VFPADLAQHGQTVQAGRVAALGADDGEQVLAQQLLGQLAGVRLKAVAGVEAPLGGFVHLFADASGHLSQQRVAPLVGRAAQHGRGVGGVEVVAAIGQPFGAALNQVVGLHVRAFMR